MVATCAPREPHVDRGPLSTCGPRGPHVGHQQREHFGHFVFPLLFPLKSPIPSHTFQEEKFEIRIFSQNFSILFWSYLSHTNSKSIDSKTKIVGLEESYKPQAFPEASDFAIFLSWSIFSPWSVCVFQLLLFQFHLWSSLDSYYLIDEICWEVC
jgi:hypothetical protein